MREDIHWPVDFSSTASMDTSCLACPSAYLLALNCSILPADPIVFRWVVPRMWLCECLSMTESQRWSLLFLSVPCAAGPRFLAVTPWCYCNTEQKQRQKATQRHLFTEKQSMFCFVLGHYLSLSTLCNINMMTRKPEFPDDLKVLYVPVYCRAAVCRCHLW